MKFLLILGQALGQIFFNNVEIHLSENVQHITC